MVILSSIARRTAKNEGIDFNSLSNEILLKIYSVFENKTLNGTETSMLYYLQKEIDRRFKPKKVVRKKRK